MRLHRWLFPLALTLILIGYLTTWHPSNVVGLRLIGWEVGEWVKFLPAFKQGNAPTNRDWFYLPPITLTAAMLLWTATWQTRQKLRRWLVGLLAIPVAFLAVPDIPIIVDEGRDQWLVRVLAFALITLLALLTPWLTKLPVRLRGVLLVIMSLAGAWLPFAAYQASRWHISDLTQQPAAIGIGLWLNVIGHLLLLLPALTWFKKSADSPSP